MPIAINRPIFRSAFRIFISASMPIAAFILREMVSRLGVVLPPFLTFAPAIVISTLLFGMWFGLFSTALSALLVAIWVFPPYGKFKLQSTSDIVALALFIAVATVLSALVERYRRYARRIVDFDREEALHASKMTLEAVLASMTDSVVMSDLQGRFIHVNDAFATIHRFKSKSECATNFADYSDTLELLDANGQPLPIATWGTPRALCGETATNVEYTVRRKDTGESWNTSYSFGPIRDENGAIAGAVVAGRDVTVLKQAVEALRASEEQFRSLANTIPHLCWMAHGDGEIFWFNDRWYQYTGATLEQMEGWEWQSLVAPDSLPNVLDHWRNSILTGEPLDTVFSLRGADGLFRPFLTRVVPVCDAKGEVVRWFGTNTDISASKRIEEALRTSEARYRAAFQTSIDAMAINRASDGMYIDVNQSFINMLGFRRDEVIGRTPWELGIWADYRDRDELVEALLRTSKMRDLEVQFKRKGGEIFWAIMSASTVELGGEHCYLSVTRDISDSKLAHEAILHLALYDPLTKLPNRRLLMDRLSKSMTVSARNHRKRGLLFLDLDDFKRLNDTLGHHMGDLMLQEVAQRVMSSVRDVDTVGRLGGDEFVVLLEDLSETTEVAAAQAKNISEKILAMVDQPYHIGDRECASSCSIGITLFGDEDENLDEILQQADIALYQSKAAGRNTIRFFVPALQDAVNARVEMEQELRHAIKNDLLMVYYQPQVEHGLLVGAEALLRWNHPRLGILSASDFIPLAEETRLILPLGNWVLESVCRQIAAWEKNNQAAGITIAVNISALQLARHDFVQSVLTALERTGANPKSLLLELTESVLMNGVEDAIAKMTVLKSLGMSFSVDDFGTGYSSLAYLKRFPLNQVKIDRSFVRDISFDTGSGAIAQAIISLGQAMGLSVIAEGVENEQQRSFLADLGCNSCQGYLFGRPLPLSEFEPLLSGFSPLGAGPLAIPENLLGDTNRIGQSKEMRG
jgi:diguanylate cyclase (GGDEF)-like protein/PAS domain S-box-containing protein